jgi:hypothetical protein
MREIFSVTTYNANSERIVFVTIKTGLKHDRRVNKTRFHAGEDNRLHDCRIWQYRAFQQKRHTAINHVFMHEKSELFVYFCTCSTVRIFEKVWLCLIHDNNESVWVSVCLVDGMFVLKSVI